MATYYGGPPQVQVAEGRHPLQSKTVTIHRLKAFTESGQKRAPDGDLLLHEFAHAVHDQLLGFDNAGIKSAYQQAMERKLYDKDLYAATSAKTSRSTTPPGSKWLRPRGGRPRARLRRRRRVRSTSRSRCRRT
jgi:hypothetical protein